VVDVARNRVVGMIPTAWYPTDVALSSDGGRIYVTSAKGLGAGPNTGPGYPNPTSGSPTSPKQHVGSMMAGSLSTIPTPGSGQLARYSQQVVANDGFDERDHQLTQAAGSPLPRRQGGDSPIRHVIYIVKENRTYDQEFGSLGKGNGDPSLNLFGDESAPNARALQRRFVTLDNFYADAEISAQGWNWSTGANSNPYVEQTWPANYSPRNHPYDFEGGNPATAPNRDPASAYLWDRLSNAGVSFRNYGFFKGAGTFNTGPGPADPLLVAQDDPNFWGYDLGCPDSSGTFTVVKTCPVPRVDEWAREFGQYVTDGKLPAVQLLRLPNDHTAGTRVGAPTPQAYVADNDYALGRVVDTVSHSPYWASTAIFVVEDDAQNGPDHVDAHRTIAQVISPYTRTGKVDSTFYSTVSMLRTMELLTGLGPLTQFDAAATPMFNAFTGHPDTTPYNVSKPDDAVLKAVNGAHAPLAAEAAKQDLSGEDRIDMTTFNQEVWQSVKGPSVPMPAPQHHVMGAGGTGKAAAAPQADGDK
jgi:phospholipase C